MRLELVREAKERVVLEVGMSEVGVTSKMLWAKSVNLSWERMWQRLGRLRYEQRGQNAQMWRCNDISKRKILVDL